ncbi:MAG: DUF4249 family protein [Gemmatimonadota bacterium]|nr:DUF4249 family protein [Gemmatimonadota bacterium]
MRKIQWIFCFVLGLGAGGCSTAPTESLGEFQETVYVEGYLRAGSPVSDLFVGTTMPLSSVYDREASALSDALVTIEVDGVSYELSPVVDKPGYYEQPDLIVESGKTYHLSVTTGLGTATAQTTVPVAPHVSGASSLLIGGDAYRVTWEGETKGGYVTTRKSVELLEQIPLATQFGRFGGGFGGGVDTTGLGALRDSIARADQWRFLQGRSLTLNSRQFSYYGIYSFLVYALDENYGDYLISSAQDEAALDEPQFHVKGGIGLFASMAADSVVFRVE